MALLAFPAGTLCATSLRRIEWKRIGFNTWMVSMTQQDRRLPMDGLQDAARGRRRHYVVADALHLHLRAGEQGMVARDQQSYSV